ncbi:MAG TPA: hypothetical protein VE870_07900 [Bacteroidales bacterium]|nr:hypothetical protein [Bacteroidales bacterium]
MDIQILSKKWMPLKPVLLKGVREVLSNQHFAIQLLAVTGKHMIPPAKNEENTTMEFSASRKMMITDKIPTEKPVRIGLNVVDFTLYILSSRLEELQMGDLANHTTTEGFNFIKKHLADYGANVSAFDLSIDYNLSTGPVDKEKSFSVEYPSIAEETVKYRANAKFLLQFFNRVFKHTSDIRVWPHNFCTSSQIFNPVTTKENSDRSVEYGFSPQNDTVDEPHFYIKIHVDKNFSYPDPLPDLRGGGRWKESDWKGAYLRISDIWVHDKPENQFNITSEFFSSGLEAALKMISKH